MRMLCGVVAWMLLTVQLQAREPCPLTGNDLRRMSPAELDAVFATGKTGAAPCGVTRGWVIHECEAKLPRVRAGMSNLIWKGKVFHEDGAFVNRWCGVRAVWAKVTLGISWYDGQPCFVVDYPPDAPLFGNDRDELREVAPGLFLGRAYGRCPCVRLKRYFVLQLEARRCR